MSRRFTVIDERFQSVRKTRPKTHNLDGQVQSVTCSADGGYVVAASHDSLYAFHHAKLLWRCRTKGNRRVIMARQGSLVVAITYEGLIALSREGDDNGQPRRLWHYETDEDIFDAVVSAEGDHILAAVGRSLILFNGQGKRLWTKKSKEFISGIGLNMTREMALAGMERALQCYNLKGELIWDHRTGGLIMGVDHTTKGDFILAASGRHPSKRIYLLNGEGQLLWEAETGTFKGLRLAEDTSLIVATTANNALGFNIEGEQLWSFHTQDFINKLVSLSSGRLTVVASGSEIYNLSRLACLDERGEQLWNFKPHGLAHDVALPEDGGTVMLAAGKKVYWLENGPLLKVETERLVSLSQGYLEELRSVQGDLETPLKLLEMVSSYLTQKQLKDALYTAREAHSRLVHLHKRYLEYRDDLPKFTERIHVDAALPERLIPTIYPLYSQHSDLIENRDLETWEELVRETQKRFKTLTTTVHQRPDDQEGPRSAVEKEVHERLVLAQAGIRELRDLLKQFSELQARYKNNLRSLEEHSRLIIMDWLTTGSITSNIKELVEQAADRARNIQAEGLLLKERVQTITAMLESHSLKQSAAIDAKMRFRPDPEGLDLAISLTNLHDHALVKVATSLYIAGTGLELTEPLSGTIELEELDSQTRKEVVFRCQAKNLTATSCHATVAFTDEMGRRTHLRLDSRPTTLLGTFIVPWKLEAEAENQWKKKHDAKSSNETLKFTNLNLKQASGVVKLCLEGFASLHENPTPDGDAAAFTFGGALITKEVKFLVTIALKQNPQYLEVYGKSTSNNKKDSDTLLSALSDCLRHNMMEQGGRLI